MKEQTFHVAIIGGGLGGLCLANGLKQAGISVAVYERDLSRIHGLKATAFTLIRKAAQPSTNVCRRICGIFSIPQAVASRAASASSPSNCTNSSALSATAAHPTPSRAIGLSAGLPCGEFCSRVWKIR